MIGRKSINLIHGEVGGCGKSFFASLMCDYLESAGVDFYLVDADASIADVSKAYPDSVPEGEPLRFTEKDERAFDADRLFDLANQQTVVVNLPAQVRYPLRSWLCECGLEEMRDLYQIEVVIWFVCLGTVETRELFAACRQEVPDLVKHVLVRNEGVRDRNGWPTFNETGDLRDLTKQVEHSFRLKPLEAKIVRWVRQNHAPWSAAEDNALAEVRLQLAAAARLRGYLKETRRDIEQAFAALDELQEKDAA